MEKFEFTQPDFFFCEIAVKYGNQNDDRIWIYHRKSLSLIEFINVDDFKDFEFKGKQDRFYIESREGIITDWFGVYVQNNCEVTGFDQDKVLKASWEYLKNYLDWIP